MALVIITIILIFFVLIIWTYKNLGDIEKNKKIAYIILGIIITYIITLIIYTFSKGQIQYPNEQIEKAIKNILVILFTGINACIIMPYIAKTLRQNKCKRNCKRNLKKKYYYLNNSFSTNTYF